MLRRRGGRAVCFLGTARLDLACLGLDRLGCGHHYWHSSRLRGVFGDECCLCAHGRECGPLRWWRGWSNLILQQHDKQEEGKDRGHYA